MEYETVRINKLKGLENWASWQFQMRVTLKSCSAWEIITGDSILPVLGDDTANRARAVWIKLNSTTQSITANISAIS